MNEKIKELAFQAAEDCIFEHATPSIVVEGEGGIYKMEIPNVFVEKFTELIVQECLTNMQNSDGDLDFAIWKTKQQFEIKE
jgi:hypothetical protein